MEWCEERYLDAPIDRQARNLACRRQRVEWRTLTEGEADDQTNSDQQRDAGANGRLNLRPPVGDRSCLGDNGVASECGCGRGGGFMFQA